MGVSTRTPENDNDELPGLRYFMICYWNQQADLLYDSIEEAARQFASLEKPSIVGGLLSDLEVVRTRKLLSRQWPKDGPVYDFWAEMGERILSKEDAAVIVRVASTALG